VALGKLASEGGSEGATISTNSNMSTGKLEKFNSKQSNVNPVPMANNNISSPGPASIQVTPTMQLLYFARLFLIFVVSVAICQIGFILYPFLTLLKPSFFRRFSDMLESLWVNACLWCFPTCYLVRHGEFPEDNNSNSPRLSIDSGLSMRPRRPSISYRSVFNNVFNVQDGDFESAPAKTPKVIICNHSTQADWFYMWMMARLCSVDRTGNVKIMLKEPIKNIPIFGWGCRLFQFIFLKRDWRMDEKVIESSLKKFCEDGEPLWIFLFPEGCTVNTRSVEKSKAFARAGNRQRPLLEKTLLPRSRGFHAVIDILNEYSEFPPEVYDMTMSFDGYSGEVPTWEMGYSRKVDVLVPTVSTFIMGTASKRCHLDSRKFSYHEIKSHPEGVEGWLDERWERKDGLMHSFGEEQGFPAKECGPGDVTLVQGSVWQSLLAVAFNLALWVCLAVVIQKKTENVSFWEVLPQYL